MQIPSFLVHTWRTALGVLLASCLVLGGARPATAAVVYDFSLAANGEVGAVSIQLTLPDFLPEGAFGVFDVSGPEVTSFSSGTPIDPASSFVGIEVSAATTLFGIRLSQGVGDVLTTLDFPADFFVFGRTPALLGSSLSTAGTVISDLALETPTPTATLVVTSAVPEPLSLGLLGLGVFGIAIWRHFRRTPA